MCSELFDLGIQGAGSPSTTLAWPGMFQALSLPYTSQVCSVSICKGSYPKQLRLTFVSSAQCRLGFLEPECSASRSRSCTRKLQCSYLAVMFNTPPSKLGNDFPLSQSSFRNSFPLENKLQNKFLYTTAQTQGCPLAFLSKVATAVQKFLYRHNDKTKSKEVRFLGSSS